MARRRILLIHATPVAVEPVHQAFIELWPEAEPFDLLDATLSVDRAAAEALTGDLTERLCLLAAYAEQRAGAEAVLFTCSAFGPAIEEAARRTRIPVLKPNQAMFEAALQQGGRVGLLATFEPSISSMAAEFEEMRQAAAAETDLVTRVVPDAMTRLRAGDAEAHNRLVAEAAGALADCDSVMLAQFSTSRARAATEAQLGRPVLTAPHAAVAALRSRLG